MTARLHVVLGAIATAVAPVGCTGAAPIAAPVPVEVSAATTALRARGTFTSLAAVAEPGCPA